MSHFLLKLANVLVYLSFLSANMYSLFAPQGDHTTPYKDLQTYITPAEWTFFVWTAIHFLFGGFVIYQWFDSASNVVHDGIGWHFVLASLFNATWLGLASYGHEFFGWIALFFVSGAISFIYYRLKESHPAESVWESLFIHLPFSLYHSWVFVLLVVNAFAIFSPITDDGPTTWQVVFVEVGLFFIASSVIGYIEYKKGDVAGALVLAWSLFGISANQDNEIIHWTSLVLGGLVTFYTTKPYILRLFGRRSEETNPLLG